jgi:hypothetical protein
MLVKIIAFELALDVYTNIPSQLIHPAAPPTPPSSSTASETADLFLDDGKNDEGPDYIIDLRLSTVIARVRQPPTIPRLDGTVLPTTAPAPPAVPWGGLSAGMMSAVMPSGRTLPPPPRRTPPTVTENRPST